MKPQRDRFVFRTHSRFPVQTPMLYIGKDFAGQGVVRELSRVGCRVLGNYPVTPGETLSLRISHPMHPHPFIMDRVNVRWVNGFEFGVAFGFLGKTEADRLHQVLDEFLTDRSFRGLPSPS